LKKALIVLLLLALPLFLMSVQKALAAEPSKLIAIYSPTSPTIDGQLGSSEWWDAAGYKINLTGTPGNVETWLYIKHNNTHMYVGLVAWQIYVNAYDQFTLFFDEGNNSIYGSGTRDYNLTVNQEDLKSCSGTNATKDGCYLADPTQFHAFDVEINFTAKSFHEIDHVTAEWEIEYWEGLTWVDDHWECEFAIPLVGYDGGAQDVSDLVCAVGDTVGFKIQYFINPGSKNYYYPEGDQNQVLNYTDLSILPPHSIESCNSTGDKKDSFNLYEDVHVNGSGFSPLTTYDFYIVNDTDTWINNTSIPARIAGTATSIVSDAYGKIAPTIVWSDPPTLGEYDMIVDVNGNGLYDEGIDALDNNDVVTAGFIIPEFTSAMLLTTLLILSTLCITLTKMKQPKKPTKFTY
jgi:hypothetical protein